VATAISRSPSPSVPLIRAEATPQRGCSNNTATLTSIAFAALASFGVSAGCAYGAVQTNYLLEEDPSNLSAVGPIYTTGFLSLVIGTAMTTAFISKWRGSRTSYAAPQNPLDSQNE